MQHVPFEGPGSIKDWAEEKNHKLSVTRLYGQDALPFLDELDWLIIMGGPMDVYEEKKYPWMAEEKTFIRRAIESGKTVIGICLGAQLIADVMGARVFPNGKKEIGWFPIQPVDFPAQQSPLPNEAFMTFHWHSNTFELPKGAEPLTRSKACKNQAFIYDERVLALQFHPEVTAESINAMILNGRSELTPATYVQSADEIIELNEIYLGPSKKFMFDTLDNLCRRRVVT